MAWFNFLFSEQAWKKRKWDSEMSRWRVLQQQLSSLRVIRAEREASGAIKATYSLENTDIIDTQRKFPWKENDER